MIKAVVRYRCEDGSEWVNIADAKFREKMISDAAKALSFLRSRPEDPNFEGFVQQSPEDISRCREALYQIANQEGVLRWWLDEQREVHGKSQQELTHTVHASWMGRLLDGAHEPLSKAYTRLCCIDQHFREWNQPYLANHPEEGKQIEVAA